MMSSTWDVDGMLESIPSRLFLEWVAYDRIEPFGSWRDDLRTGIIASTVANCARTSKSSKSFKPSDFIPEFKPVEEPEERLSLLDKLKFLAKSLGAKTVKKEPQP